jgi:polyisoprenoid-binding protein YceI
MSPADDDVAQPAFVEQRPSGTLIPVIPPGRWAVDPTRSTISFVAKHLLITKVTGTFTRVAGTIVVGDDVATSSVSAMADADSLTTGDAARDEHLRSPEFFDVDRWPTLTLVGSGLRSRGNRHTLETVLTIRDVSHPVTFEVTAANLDKERSTPDRPVARFTADAEVNRKDWGLRWNAAIETGGVVVGDMVRLVIVAVAELTP